MTRDQRISGIMIGTGAAAFVGLLAFGEWGALVGALGACFGLFWLLPAVKTE